MSPNNSQQPKTVTFLVPSAGTTLLATGNLFHATNNGTNLANQQLGIVSVGKGFTRAFNAMVQAGDTPTQAPLIKIVQGTPNSANFNNVSGFRYGHLPYVESATIDSSNPIHVTFRAAALGQFSAFAIGDVGSAVSAIPETDEASYIVHVTFDGVRQNKVNSQMDYDGIDITFKSPDYTALSSIYTDPRDHIVQNLAFRFNSNSKYFNFHQLNLTAKKPIIAFAINSAGGSGTALSTITATSSVPVLSTNGSTYSYASSAEFVSTIASWIAAGTNNITGSSTIETINLSTAGTSSGLGTDVLILMALDETLAAALDEETSVKVQLRVGIENALTTFVAKNEISRGFEGQGKGRDFMIQWKRWHRPHIYSLQRFEIEYYQLPIPDYIDDTASYNAIIIEHYEQDYIPYSGVKTVTHVTIILIPATSSGTGNATTVASLNAVLLPWLNGVSALNKENYTTLSNFS